MVYLAVNFNLDLYILCKIKRFAKKFKRLLCVTTSETEIKSFCR